MTRHTYLHTEFANVSLDLIGPGGLQAIENIDHLVQDIQTEREIEGSLQSVFAVENRFIVGVTGGFVEETF